jgi:type IV pilus assembly protein PilQ
MSFGQRLSAPPMLDKDGEQYDLSQKMSINMKDSDIKNVLMLIGELTGLNIVVSPSVRDTITANLENVSVKAALDVILKPNGYSYFTQENIIIVKGADGEIVRELETVVLKLKYINSDDLAGPLSAVLSDQGKVQSFTPVVTTSGAGGVSNVIIISDVQERIPNILKMVEDLDKPIANVNISVRFIESGVDSAKGTGIDWSRNTPIFLGGATDTSGSLWPFKLNDMTIATLNPFQFGQAWRLMQARGESKILASPQITTLDNHTANTQITTTIYIEGSVSNMGRSGGQNNTVTGGGGATNTNANQYGYNSNNTNSRQITEKDVGIDLQVTPRINDENRITLLVNASVEALLSAAEVATDKPRSTRRTVSTQVTVNAGDTVIIGGLIAENAIENRKFVPVLSDLPFIGKIFQSTTIDKEQRELLIFITPNVVG